MSDHEQLDEFTKAVLAAVPRIPPETVATYSEVGKRYYLEMQEYLKKYPFKTEDDATACEQGDETKRVR